MSTVSVVFRPSSVDEMREQVVPMMERHVAEVGDHPDVLGFDPDWSVYYALERNDALSLLVAEEGGEVVGYSVAMLTTHPDAQTARVATCSAIYVRPSARRDGIGIDLIGATERAAAERGADVLMLHAKPDSTMDKILRCLDAYNLLEKVYSREVF